MQGTSRARIKQIGWYGGMPTQVYARLFLRLRKSRRLGGSKRGQIEKEMTWIVMIFFFSLTITYATLHCTDTDLLSTVTFGVAQTFRSVFIHLYSSTYCTAYE